MNPRDSDIPISFLVQCFDANPNSGALIWRTRSREHFRSESRWRQFNTRFAGKAAGTRQDKGYLQVTLAFDGRRRTLMAHRIIFALAHGRWPDELLDHAHGVEAGNGVANLREATHSQNNQNRSATSRSTSGLTGVFWNKRHKKWRAHIVANGRRMHLGSFNSRETAHAAYLAAKAELHPFQPVPRDLSRPARRWRLVLEDGTVIATAPTQMKSVKLSGLKHCDRGRADQEDDDESGRQVSQPELERPSNETS